MGLTTELPLHSVLVPASQSTVDRTIEQQLAAQMSPQMRDRLEISTRLARSRKARVKLLRSR